MNINLNEAVARARSELQVYSRLFYASRVKAIVDPQLVNVPQNAKLSTRMKLTAEIYENEDDDIKAAVKEEAEKEAQRRKEGREVLEKLVGSTSGPPEPNEVAQ